MSINSQLDGMCRQEKVYQADTGRWFLCHSKYYGRPRGASSCIRAGPVPASARCQFLRPRGAGSCGRAVPRAAPPLRRRLLTSSCASCARYTPLLLANTPTPALSTHHVRRRRLVCRAAARVRRPAGGGSGGGSGGRRRLHRPTSRTRRTPDCGATGHSARAGTDRGYSCLVWRIASKRWSMCSR